MADLIIDKEFHALLPALTPDEYNGLQEQILADGCTDPIIVWGNIVIDGMNRYEICREHKKGFRVVNIQMADREAVKAWIIKHQLGRRNLTPSQRSMLAAGMVTAKEGRPNNSAPVQSITVQQAAKAADVSPRSVETAKAVIKHGTPALAKAVRDGKVSVAAAAKQAAKKDEPPALVDRFGVAIPDIKSCREGLARADEVAALMREVSALKGKILGLLDNEKDPIYSVVDKSVVDAAFTNVYGQLKNAKPYAVCPHCGGGDRGAMKRCTACSGNGWLSEFGYRRVPKELK
jgi:hypothetical protein